MKTQRRRWAKEEAAGAEVAGAEVAGAEMTGKCNGTII